MCKYTQTFSIFHSNPINSTNRARIKYFRYICQTRSLSEDAKFYLESQRLQKISRYKNY